MRGGVFGAMPRKRVTRRMAAPGHLRLTFRGYARAAIACPATQPDAQAHWKL